MEKQFCVYIMASQRNGTVYVGVTSDLIQRVYQHKHNQAEGFTQQHAVHHLVYFERHESADSAIHREKRLKEWQRKWKLDLIEEKNPEWIDLYPSLLG